MIIDIEYLRVVIDDHNTSPARCRNHDPGSRLGLRAVLQRTESGAIPLAAPTPTDGATS